MATKKLDAAASKTMSVKRTLSAPLAEVIEGRHRDGCAVLAALADFVQVGCDQFGNLRVPGEVVEPSRFFH